MATRTGCTVKRHLCFLSRVYRRTAVELRNHCACFCLCSGWSHHTHGRLCDTVVPAPVSKLRHCHIGCATLRVLVMERGLDLILLQRARRLRRTRRRVVHDLRMDSLDFRMCLPNSQTSCCLDCKCSCKGSALKTQSSYHSHTGWRMDWRCAHSYWLGTEAWVVILESSFNILGL